MSSTGLASSFRSVPDLWHHRIGSTPDSEAMRYRDRGRWRTMSWGDAGARVRAIANGLLGAGLAREQRCVVMAETCVEWILADFAILCAGGATTTIWPEAADGEVAFIVADCEAVLAFVGTPQQAERLRRLRPQLPTLTRVVVFSGPSSEDGWVVSLAEFERRGGEYGAAHPEAYGEAHRSVVPTQLATLMYTSGTTGRPKGVMLAHDAWVYEAEAIDALGFMNPADVQLLWLPLAHVFAKVLQLTFVRLGIPTVVDGSSEDLVDNLRETRPTWFAGVPRTFEKSMEAILERAEGSGLVRRQLFSWALGIGRRHGALVRKGLSPGPVLSAKLALADRLVFREIRERYGGRLRFMISGGAPLPPEIAEFFHAIGLLILEGYGLTESAAASCVNRLDDWRFGTVGPPLPGCEVKIAQDGEILLRSRGVMKGYWRLPAETAASLGPDGFLRTGDIGRLLQTGHLQITGRKKEIIVTAGGKNVPPLHVETLLTSRCPYLSHALLHGDGRPFCTALVTLDEPAVLRWLQAHPPRTREGARDAPPTLEELSAMPEIRELIQSYVDAINRELPAFEQVRKFAILPEGFTQQNGLLTPSLKVKRGEVERRFASIIEEFYESGRVRLPAAGGAAPLRGG